MLGCGLLYLAQDRDHWRALTNKSLNFVHNKLRGNFLVFVDCLHSQEGICSMELVIYLWVI